MNFMKRIFAAFDAAYLKRAYAISAFYLVAMISLSLRDFHNALENNSFWGAAIGIFVLSSFFILSFLLYPFSKLVWDEIKAAIMGDTILIFPNLLVMYGWKFGINYVLWLGAILIAPLGILYLTFHTRTSKGARTQEE